MSALVIRINEKTLSASVHSRTCPVVTRRQPKGYAVHQVTDDSAVAAAARFDLETDVADRGLAKTKVCACAGGAT